MKVYLVGGAVRDQLLGHPYSERDWVVVGATPEELLNLGYQQVGKDFPVFLHPKTKEEYALARTERKSGQGYHGFICDFGVDVTLEEDLQRRDLTINAMAQDNDGNIIDPYGGQQDLRDRVLRHVSPAFSEDPLRVLRVARFAARYAHLGFKLAPETRQLMHAMSEAGELSTITPERIWVELNKALSTKTPSEFLRILLDCGALAALFPDWAAAINDTVLNAVDCAAAAQTDNDIRFALSCHTLPAPQCEALCTALRASNNARDLALLSAELLPLTSDILSESLEASAVLALLEKLDYLRRPERLQDFVQAATILQEQTPHPALALLPEAAVSLGAIKAQALLEKGLKGPALGKALRDARLDALAELITHSR
jgi:tRNA nucleotidyltransferase (CCA-adding enzyme)